MKKQDFAHLHVHTEYSILDGCGKLKDYVEYAKEKGFEYLAITDHGNIDGAIKFQSACIEGGVKPIFGCELYVVADRHIKEKENRKHLTVLVENQTGWSNLLNMLTEANLNGFYRRPRVDPNLILENCEGLYFLSACLGTILTEDWGKELFLKLKNKKINVALEIMPHEIKEQHTVNDMVIKFSKKHNIILVVTNDCHYIKKEDSLNQEVLLAIQTKKRWKDENRWRFSVDGFYLKTKREMIRSFKNIDRTIVREAIENTIKIAEKCSKFNLPKIAVQLPKIKMCEENKSINEEHLLMSICKDRLIELELQCDKRYTERLDFEYEVLKKNDGFIRYFLIVWDLVKWCKESNIMVGPGRGSCGSSLISYLMNITTVDPIEFKLIFARFINPGRIDLPDIDLDFEDIKRPIIRRYLQDSYGFYNVCGVSTFSTMKGRGALTDVSRVFDIPVKEVKIATKCVDGLKKDGSIEEAINNFEDAIKFYGDHEEVVEIAISLEGQVRNHGQHSAGICISRDDLRYNNKIVFVERKKNLCCNWDKYDIEHQGLMKLDVLGLNALTVLNYARELIKKKYNIDIDYYNMSLEGEKYYKEFNKGNTVGCFQLTSLGLKNFCKQLGIEKFEDIVNATSLFRPGTLRSGLAKEFVERKNKRVRWDYDHPSLKKVTKDTYGVFLYQEQIMQLCVEVAGLDWSMSDTIRKAIAKSKGKEELEKFRNIFIDGCNNRDVMPERKANEIWDQVVEFGGYVFNLSHSVEYSYITFWDMKIKLDYPVEFIIASLTYGNKEHKQQLIEEAFRLGIDIRSPKIGKSDIERWKEVNDILYAPFSEIKGLGDKKLNSIFPKGKFSNVKLTPSIKKILDDVRVYDDEEMNDVEGERIAKHFDFSFVKDRSRKFKRIIELIEEKVKLSKISDANKLKGIKYFFGMMIDLKMKVKEDKETKLSSVTAYGNFTDKTGNKMINFSKELYKNKKNEIEHCSEKFILLKAEVGKNNISCVDVWIEDELLSCQFEGFDIEIKKQQNNVVVDEVFSCEKCTECDMIEPKVGRSNIMIVFDNPTMSNVDNFFDTKNGKFVVDYFKALGINKREFYITSVYKSKSEKKLTKRDYNKCSHILKKEIEQVKPLLVLSFGNGARCFFTGKETGIIDDNAKVEWNNIYNCWVCYSITPAMLNYKGNEELMKLSLGAFSDCLK